MSSVSEVIDLAAHCLGLAQSGGSSGGQEGGATIPDEEKKLSFALRKSGGGRPRHARRAACKEQNRGGDAGICHVCDDRQKSDGSGVACNPARQKGAL